jgi:hypothetical protein
VEAVTPILSRPARERCWEIMQVILADQRQAWDMQSDGSYRQRDPGPGTDPIAAQGDASSHDGPHTAAQREQRAKSTPDDCLVALWLESRLELCLSPQAAWKAVLQQRVLPFAEADRVAGTGVPACRDRRGPGHLRT